MTSTASSITEKPDFLLLSRAAFFIYVHLIQGNTISSPEMKTLVYPYPGSIHSSHHTIPRNLRKLSIVTSGVKEAKYTLSE